MAAIAFVVACAVVILNQPKREQPSAALTTQVGVPFPEPSTGDAEERRHREIWVDLVRAERRALREAEQQHPNAITAKPSKKMRVFGEKWHQLDATYRDEVLRRHGLTKEAADAIGAEAGRKLWSMPNDEG